MLDNLKTQKSQNGFESFLKALRSAKKQEKIQACELRLRKMREQMNTLVLSILRKGQSNMTSMFRDLRGESTRAEHHILEKINALREELMREPRLGLRGTPSGAVARKCLELVEEGKRATAYQIILNSLYFEGLRTRHYTIKEAYTDTLKWIFPTSDTSTSRPVHVVEWLEAENGIFWIAGKAGSGKSTLMKTLSDHPRTRDALGIWAGDQKLIIASHYFWSTGDKMQKSQEGLLQTLLYQILRQCPDLIPSICQERHQAALTSQFYSGYADTWSRQELFKAFDILPDLDLSSRFCFFIDGLDEYDGEDSEIVLLLQILAYSPSIKICVSSRPRNEFTDAFGGERNRERTLLLQDFNREDIEHYVKRHLRDDVRFQKLMSEDTGCEQLIQDIVTRSQGVFLWVYLVVQSLLRGLADDNDISILQRRLEAFPRELDQYFKQMLDTIEDIYQDHTVKIFQLMLHTMSPLSALSLSFLEKEMVDPDYAKKARIETFRDEQIEGISLKAYKHMDAYCKDLVEIVSVKEAAFNFSRYKVDFLHRTARDFLLTDNMQDFLRSRTGPSFDARISLCKILLALIKGLPHSQVSPQETSPFFPPSFPDPTPLFHDLYKLMHEIKDFQGAEVIDPILEEVCRVTTHYSFTLKTHGYPCPEIFQDFNHGNSNHVETVATNIDRLYAYISQRLGPRLIQWFVLMMQIVLRRISKTYHFKLALWYALLAWEIIRGIIRVTWIAKRRKFDNSVIEIEYAIERLQARKPYYIGTRHEDRTRIVLSGE